MLYFSYGSNMSSRRLLERVSSAHFITVATLYCHELRCHKVGRDGSGKCDAFETGERNHSVIGAVFDISASEKPCLDEKEGLGRGYEKKMVSLLAADGRPIEAVTYYATIIDPSLKPFHWYKLHVLTGAVEHGLPQDYIELFAQIESVPDPDIRRQKQETALYL
jgi:gamma-glutamylcyclotransferase